MKLQRLPKLNKAIILLAFLYFFSPSFALASLSYEIPYTLDNNQNGLILCDIPPYNNVIHFRSYRIGKSGPGSSLLNGTTFGNGVCTGSLNASLGPGGNFDPANGQGLDGTPGIYYLTFYLGSNYTDPYGYMAFNCTLSSCTPHRETPLPLGFLHWDSFSITNPTPPISISCSNSSEPRYLMTKENFNLISPDYVYDATNENLHIINGNPLCTDTLTITEEPTGDYVFFGGSDIGANRIIIERVQFLHFDTGTDTFSIPNTICTTDCFSNVLFLPGIMGSRLYEQESILGIPTIEDQLWEPNHNNDVRELYLDPQTGESLNPNIYTKDVIDESLDFATDIYKGFLSHMNSMVVNNDIKRFETMPYDWRMDVKDIATSPIKLPNGNTYSMVGKVEELASDSPNTGKVTIIGHSNGGLVAKALISELERQGKADLVDKVMLVATPQLGTPEAILSTLHGMSFFWSFPKKEVMRELGENMKSAYTLIPSLEYFNNLPGTTIRPLVEFDTDTQVTAPLRLTYGESISDYETLRSFLLGEDGRTEPAPSDVDTPNVLKENFLTNAFTRHLELDDWQVPAGIGVVEIIGWGLKTIRGIEYTSRKEKVCEAICYEKEFIDPQPLFTSEGDKTVVYSSADYLGGEKYYLDIANYNDENNTVNRNHKNILEISPLQELVKKLLRNEPTDTLPNFISTTKPDKSTLPKEMQLEVHSPVTLHIYDSQGRHTGPTANINPDSDLELYEEQIPNSYYMQLGEGQYAGMGAENISTVELRGTGLGTFTFNIEEVVSDEVVKMTSFQDIPVNINSVASIDIGGVITESLILLDIDNDGITDTTLTEEGISAENLVGILKGFANTLNLEPKKDEKLLKKIDKLEKVLNKEFKNECKEKMKTKKAFETLEKFIKKLEKKGLLTPEETSELLDITNKIKSGVV